MSLSDKPLVLASRVNQNDEGLGVMERIECCMCGDIGLEQELIRCRKCHFRLQHTYCSHSYPMERSYEGICNWCDCEKPAELSKDDSENLGSPKEQNEFEMLLEAATWLLEKEREFERSSNSNASSQITSICKKKRRKILRRRSYNNPRPRVNAMEGRKIGQRYKCILDVY